MSLSVMLWIYCLRIQIVSMSQEVSVWNSCSLGHSATINCVDCFHRTIDIALARRSFPSMFSHGAHGRKTWSDRGIRGPFLSMWQRITSQHYDISKLSMQLDDIVSQIYQFTWPTSIIEENTSTPLTHLPLRSQHRFQSLAPCAS